MYVAESPGSKARNFTISNRLCTSVPCSMQRLAAVAKVPGPHLNSPSINEAPPTRCHAGRLVRVAYHAACCKMGAPGMDLTLVCGGLHFNSTALSLPTKAADTAGISTRRCRDQICPTRMTSPSQQASGFAVGAGLSLLFAARLRTIGVAIHGRLFVHLPYAPSSHRPARWRYR